MDSKVPAQLPKLPLNQLRELRGTILIFAILNPRDTLYTMDPNTPVDQRPGVGKYYFYKLKKLEIETLEDLVYHFPFRYDDYSDVRGIGEVRELTAGEKISVVGNILQIKNIRTRYGKFITRATVMDDSGTLDIVWFNQPYLTKNITPGTQISLSGKVKQEGKRFQLVSPQYEIIRNQSPVISNQLPDTIHTGRLVPIYPETEGVGSKWFRTKIARFLPEYLQSLQDFLPEEIVKRNNFIDIKEALTKIHFPLNYLEAEEARKRLGFDELFLFQLIAQIRKRDWQNKRRAPKMKIDKEKILSLVKSLSFKLTHAQNRASREIVGDLQREIPANRLLEGDVGSGKTVVAAIAAHVAYLNGLDTLVAAPTEILAFQHHKTFQNTLSSFGVEVGIWTGSKKQKGHITCGTHALLTTFKPDRQVGLVIVDEQHRFGVAQRAKLFLDQSKKLTPHLLTMTATPIPRTLALTLYGDLDLSVLDEMPLGRQKISTHVVPNNKRNDAYKFIAKQIEEGRQAFIITPFVEPSETMVTVKAATIEFEKLKKVFSSLRDTPGVKSGRKSRNTPGVKLGLLHGRLKSKEKEKIIDDFKANKINILVTTPVVEVGIDVPNATVMMIESAERFGLAQLHQLRGRVGRGEHKSYCLLFTESGSPNSFRRLKSMEKVHVGFELAEIDLKMRGPGEIFGLKQSGFVNLKIADLSDQITISKAQSEAKNLLNEDPNLKSYPLLAQKLEALSSAYAQPN